MRFKFFKEEDNRWFIHLPEWEGDKSDLEMVLGADYLLDMIGQGETEVNINITSIPKSGYVYELSKYKEENEGYWYFCKNVQTNQIFELWLCSVTLFALGEFPEKIYIL